MSPFTWTNSRRWRPGTAASLAVAALCGCASQPPASRSPDSPARPASSAAAPRGNLFGDGPLGSANAAGFGTLRLSSDGGPGVLDPTAVMAQAKATEAAHAGGTRWNVEVDWLDTQGPASHAHVEKDLQRALTCSTTDQPDTDTLEAELELQISKAGKVTRAKADLRSAPSSVNDALTDCLEAGARRLTFPSAKAPSSMRLHVDFTH